MYIMYVYMYIYIYCIISIGSRNPLSDRLKLADCWFRLYACTVPKPMPRRHMRFFVVGLGPVADAPMPQAFVCCWPRSLSLCSDAAGVCLLLASVPKPMP